MHVFVRRRTSALAEGLLRRGHRGACLPGCQAWSPRPTRRPARPDRPRSRASSTSATATTSPAPTAGSSGTTTSSINGASETELTFLGDAPDDAPTAPASGSAAIGHGKHFLVAAGGVEQARRLVDHRSPRPPAPSESRSSCSTSRTTPRSHTRRPIAAGVAFTNTNSVAAYYAENSWGQLTITGDVFGWYTIPDNDTGCATNTWANSANAAAAAAGVNLGTYDNVVYAFPSAASCGWSGLGQMPGRLTWLNGGSAMSLRVMAHELGHNFGTHHSSSLNCTSSGTRVSLSATSSDCVPNEYGDPFSVMGAASGYHHTNFSAGNFGWLQAANTVTATASGDFTLRPAEFNNPTGLQVLRVLRASNSYLTLEFRQPYPQFDNFATSAPVVNGVTVRIAAGYTTRSQSQLVDATPGTASASPTRRSPRAARSPTRSATCRSRR